MWRPSLSNILNSNPFISAICLFRNHLSFIANAYFFDVSTHFIYVDSSTVNYGMYKIKWTHIAFNQMEVTLNSTSGNDITVDYAVFRWSFYWQLCILTVNSWNLKPDPVRLQVGTKIWHLHSLHSLLPVHRFSSPANPLHCSLNLISHEISSKIMVSLESDMLYSLEQKSVLALYGSNVQLAYAALHQCAGKCPSLPPNTNIPTL